MAWKVEGKIGYFESSNYKSNPSLKPGSLEYMDKVYNYAYIFQ